MTNENISPIIRIEALYASLSRALQLHAAGKVHPAVGQLGIFVVESPAGYYVVANGVCTCPEATQESDLLQGYANTSWPWSCIRKLRPARQAPPITGDLESKVRDLFLQVAFINRR